MNRQEQPVTADGREIARVGQEEFDVWPVWCTRANRSCRQLLPQGPLMLEVLREEITAAVIEAFNRPCPHCGRRP